MRALSVGERLPELALPITPTMVVSTALATRDFQDVHHDRDRAHAAGSRDIFVNILTSTGLCERYVTEWAGADVELRGVALRLGAPAYPYDTLTFSGSVTAIEDGVATIAVTGAVSTGSTPGGDHVTATVRIAC